MNAYIDRDLEKSLHELGHYIVAEALGFQTGNLHIGCFKNGSEINLSVNIKTIEEILSYLEKRVQVLYAGAVAQALNKGKVDETKAKANIDNYECENDYAKARELIRLIRNISFKESFNENEINRQLNEISLGLWEKTITIVEAKSEISLWQ
jgi:hypothetical protein